MGIICTYYRVEDKWIDLLIQLPDEVDNWINQFSKWIDREEVESKIYDLDQAWDVAQFLLNQCDTSEAKILRKVIRQAPFIKEGQQKINSPRYLWSGEVKVICHELQKIREGNLKSKWDKQKMLDARVYRSTSFSRQKDWKYIMEHVDTIKKAFLEASESNHSLICRIE